MNKEEIKKLKNGGIMKQIQRDLFSLRLRIAGGNVTSEQMRVIVEVADNYGKGYVHLTTRQGIEISFVSFSDIERARKRLAEAGIEFGACGKRIRTIVGCQGSEMCSHGLINSKQWSSRIDKDYHGREVPAKFKIAITGCTFSCAKPQENDLGFSGVLKPKFNKEACISCELCVRTCCEGAIKMVEGKPSVDWNLCNFCGKCAASCPVEACHEDCRGVAVWVGGKVGRKPRLADLAASLIPEDRIPQVIERTLDFFKSHADEEERFGDLIDRVGLNTFKREVFYDF